jgi:hypothetical protein
LRIFAAEYQESLRSALSRAKVYAQGD